MTTPQSTTQLVRRSDVLRVQVELLLMLADAATPGPWDVRDGWIISRRVDGDAGCIASGRADEDRYAYYGGELICESVCGVDARFIATARNMMPAFAEAYLDLLDQLRRAERDLIFARKLATYWHAKYTVSSLEMEIAS